MNFPIPQAALAKHIAIVGMTGSGKTTTEKGLVETVVHQDARVCILDTVKSDWWGLTSNRAGTGPGLPFQILGGPHGHVPLHAGAGAAIAELVATGKLPLSIIDMADFGPGGLQRFFNDFAPVLLKKMRGVLYLIIEEAHEVCPKEKSGVIGENMTVYHAKKLATAGRSKGLRLVVATQRVQALHNAVLSSCETVVVHRIVYPADQEPVVKWLRGSVKDKAIREQIEGSMPNLGDGEAWVCSGSAKILQRVQFPRIHTFDNSATPEDDSALDSVVTAKVDADKLRALIGDAVKDAEANDPVALKKQIAELQRQVRAQSNVAATPAIDTEARDAIRRDAAIIKGLQDAVVSARRTFSTLREWQDKAAIAAANLMSATEANFDKATLNTAPAAAYVSIHPQKGVAPATRAALVKAAEHVGRVTNGSGASLSSAARKVLGVLAQYPEGCEAGKLTLLTGYRYTGTFRNALSELRTAGFMEGDNGSVMRITDEGRGQGPFPQLPEGDDLLRYWLNQPNFSGAARKILAELQHGDELTADQLCQQTNYEYTGTFRNALSELRTAGVLVGKNTETMRISREIVP